MHCGDSMAREVIVTADIVKKRKITVQIVKISLLDKSSEALKEDEKLTLEFLKERNTDIEIKAKLTEIEKELNDVDDKIDSSYTKAIVTAKDYADSSYERLYTHINDTTLTFDYDVRTKPESQQQEKIIYDNNDDLYDGEYHD